MRVLDGLDGTIAEGFRSAMRRLAASVHIATTRDATGYHGMTVAAATRAHAAMIESGRLCLNLLGAGEEALASRFAGATEEIGLERFDPQCWALDAPAGPPSRMHWRRST